jgi:DNA polymerase-4
MLAWLGQKSIKVLWGVGPKCAEALATIGLKTVRDLQSVNPRELQKVVTPTLAEHLLALAFGKDFRLVQSEHVDKSYSREVTYVEDTLDVEGLKRQLLWITQDVGRRLREAGVRARTARIKIRYAGFRTVTRQMTFQKPVCDDFALRDAAWKLLDQHLEQTVPVRLIGFGADNLMPTSSASETGDLFEDYFNAATSRAKEEHLSHTLDVLRKRFGNAITDAMNLK